MHISQPGDNASLVALDVAMYSTFVVEVLVHSYSFYLHEMDACPNINQYPDADF